MAKRRILRVLEYIYDDEYLDIEKVLGQNAVNGTRHFSNTLVIREGYVGRYPEFLGEEEREETK